GGEETVGEAGTVAERSSLSESVHRRVVLPDTAEPHSCATGHESVVLPAADLLQRIGTRISWGDPHIGIGCGLIDPSASVPADPQLVAVRQRPDPLEAGE